ncbi:MAG: hypothetical protein JO255_17135, partial [Alphaproteobacteria bacterium]|nr:hypothetical protein [Alphaproteobacteria bacterium]
MTAVSSSAMQPSTASNASSLPRVLFVTPAAFNQVSGGGITFSNLFRGWPRDRLATVHNDRVPVSRDVCASYYELSDAELVLPAVLRRLRSRVQPAGAAAVSSGGS